MKKFPYLIIISFIILACSPRANTGTIEESLPHLKISLSFNAESYPWLMGKKYPQMALWIADKKTGETTTVFVTEKGAKKKWFGARERPSAMPVWYGTAKPEQQPEEGRALDAVTGATPSGDTFTILWQVPESLRDREVDIYLEANVSFDYNDYYKKNLPEGSPEYSGVNGQPSLIWRAPLRLSGKHRETEPKIIGHGHVTGIDGAIDRDLSKVTTAKKLFDYIRFAYIPGKNQK